MSLDCYCSLAQPIITDGLLLEKGCVRSWAEAVLSAQKRVTAFLQLLQAVKTTAMAARDLEGEWPACRTTLHTAAYSHMHANIKHRGTATYHNTSLVVLNSCRQDTRNIVRSPGACLQCVLCPACTRASHLSARPTGIAAAPRHLHRLQIEAQQAHVTFHQL